MKQAYLILHIDTSDPKRPKITDTGIYSESAGTLTCGISRKRYSIDLVAASGRDLENAIDELWELKKFSGGALDWAFALLPERDREGR